MARVQIASEKYLALKKEVSRLASMANKRLRRLERNELTDLPAYQSWVKDGAVKFSVKGKDYNQLQAELARLNRFLDSKTSTVREANKHLKEIAEMTGVKYKSVKELPNKLENFFRLSEKVEEYLRNVEGSASAIGYHRIWEVVNEVVESEEMDLDQTEDELTEEMIQKINELLEMEHEAEWIRAEMNWKEITSY